MSAVFGRDGFRALRGAWLLLASSIVAGAVIVGVSHWYLEREKRESLNAGSRLQQARARLDNARRERDSLQQSVEVYRTLVDRGLLQSEQRLDLVELVNSLRSRYHLFTLDYEIFPQRPLALSGGRVYPSIDVLASRVKIKARALHEGDVLGFVEALAGSRQGFYPVDRCTMRRIEAAEALQPHVEAECTLEWVTLKEKRGGNLS